MLVKTSTEMLKFAPKFGLAEYNVVRLNYKFVFGSTPMLHERFDELILNFHWYPYNLQPYIVVFLVGLATQTLNFAPKYGLAG